MYNGIHPENESKVWETTENMKRRMNSVLDKYKKYQRVIIVCHGMIIKTIINKEKIGHVEIIEYILKDND